MDVKAWWRARQWLWRHSTCHRSRVCRRYGRAGGYVEIVTRGVGHVAARGVDVCGSVWTCPQCAAVVAARRLPAIARAAELMECPVMVTLTTWHKRGERLDDVWARAAKAWLRARRGKAGWKGEYVRVSECTTGDGGGWHPHFHVLCEKADASRLVERWLRFAPGAAVEGQDVSERVRPEGVGHYLAAELLGATGKTRSHWSLLRRASTGDGEAAAQWWEFEAAISTMRPRQVTWSRALRALVAVEFPDAFAEDGSVASEVEEWGDGEPASEVVLCIVTSADWQRLGERRALVELMGAAAAWDAVRVCAVLADVCQDGYRWLYRGAPPPDQTESEGEPWASLLW